MQLKPQYVRHVKRLATRQLLTPGPMKTLSFIAYRQPVTQSYLAKVRGNLAYSHVKQLREIGLISEERLGRTKVLRTTPNFADYFNLSHEPQAREEATGTPLSTIKSRGPKKAQTSNPSPSLNQRQLPEANPSDEKGTKAPTSQCLNERRLRVSEISIWSKIARCLNGMEICTSARRSGGKKHIFQRRRAFEMGSDPAKQSLARRTLLGNGGAAGS